MLLSIVECNDYRLASQNELSQAVVDKLSDNIEVVRSIFDHSAARMRNRGARVASGEWLFFKDFDCAVDENKILKIIDRESRREPGLAAIGGYYSGEPMTSLDRAYRKIQRIWTLRGVYKKRQGLLPLSNHLLGGSFLVKRSVFLELGGFSQVIGWGAEEPEFIMRLRDAGYYSALSLQLETDHRSHMTLFPFLKRAWIQNYHRGLFNVSFQEVGSKKLKWFYLRNGQNFCPYSVLFFMTAHLAYRWGSFRRGVREREVQHGMV
ncbi:MAG: glycosyltransferase [Pseudomonadota bacterium]